VRERLRLPLVLVAAVVVAEGAVLLMRPRDAGPDPLPVEARAYFTPAQITRAEDFRGGQLWLYGARVAIDLGVLVLIVRRPPPALRRVFRRPVLAGAATAAAISLSVAVATLPVRAIARERARDVGLITQGWPGWAGDVARAEAIGAGIAAGGGALLVFGMRRFRRGWWVPGSAAVVAFAVVITYASPIVLEPIFNRFTPLPAGETRTDVLALARRAGVEVGEVYVMDASRRTTAANAYVAGLGRTKRVVLYDTLLRDFSPAEVRHVVAHELGHVHHADVPRGLLWLALVAPAGMLAAARLGERLAAGGTATPPHAAVPAVALSLAALVPAVTAVSNQLSRDVERRADAFALRLTGEPRTLIDFQRRITVKNVSDPSPPRVVQALLGTHPTALERIGLAEAFSGRESPAAGDRPAAPRGGS
jgi:STE24 endopeptidase